MVVEELFQTSKGGIGKYPYQFLRVDPCMVWGNKKIWVKQSPNGGFRHPHREEKHKGVWKSKLDSGIFI